MIPKASFNLTVKNKFPLILLFFVFIEISSIYAQNYNLTHDLELDYKEGLRLFNEKRYSSAQQYFDRLTNREQRIGFKSISSDAEYFAAICAIETHCKDAASRVLQFIENHPGSPRQMMAHFQMGRHLYRLKDYVSAAKWFDKVTRQDLTRDQLSEFFFKKGYCAYMTMNYELANRMFYELLDMPKSDFYEAALYYYSHLEYEKKNYQTALLGFEKLSKSQAFGSLTPYYIAQIYFLQKRYDNVVEYVPQHFDQVVPARSAEMKRILGDAHFKTEKYDSAAFYLEQYKEITESFERYDLYQLGYAYYKIKDYEKASKNFTLVTNTPDSLSQNAYYHLADCYLKLNDKKNAHLAFGNAWRMSFLKEIQEDALFNYSKLTYELSFAAFNETIKNFETYLEMFPESGRRNEIYDYLVKVYLTGRNYKEAIASLKRIKESNRVLDNARQRTTFYYGIELFTNLEFAEAEKILKQCVETKGNDLKMRAMAIYWLAESYNRQEKFADALQMYNQFLTTPGAYNTNEYRLANYNIGYIFFKQKNYTKTLRWMNLFIAKPTSDSRFTTDAHLRIGDCYFAQRQFLRAVECYDNAIKTSSGTNEYARFQKGISYGLIDKSLEKIDVLSYFFTQNSSIYADVAIFEIAKAYTRIKNNEKAIEAYQFIVNTFPNSLLKIKSQLQSGLMAFNNGNNALAINYLKKVITLQPASPEAAEALQTLKNVYLDLNDIDSYFAYAQTVNQDVSKSEQDSLTFLAAERMYLANDCTKAIAMLTSYLTKFPNGQFHANSEFYKGQCALKLQDSTLALKSFANVIEQPRNIFTILAAYQIAQISFKQKNYNQAIEAYTLLNSIADDEDMLTESKVGIMRCNIELNRPKMTIEACKNVLSLPGIPQELQIEATYQKAQAYYALDSIEKALTDYKLLATNTRIAEGAESRFRLAEIAYKQGKIKEAEQQISEFIKQSTPHFKWLGNSFILLATIYKQKGDNFQAKAYLQSLLDNYPNDTDGIKLAATDSLRQITDIENKTFDNQTEEVIIDMGKTN